MLWFSLAAYQSTPKLSSLKKQPFIISMGRGSRSGLVGCLCGNNQDVNQGCRHLKSDSCHSWPMSVSHHVACLSTWELVSPSTNDLSEREPKMDTIVFIILEVRFHHFCHILLVRSRPLSLVHAQRRYTRCEFQEAGITGDQLRGCQAQDIGCFFF